MNFGFYDAGLRSLLDGSLDWEKDRVRAWLVDYYRYLPLSSHTNIRDVGRDAVVARQRLVRGRRSDGGRFFGDTLFFPVVRRWVPLVLVVGRSDRLVYWQDLQCWSSAGGSVQARFDDRPMIAFEPSSLARIFRGQEA